MRYYIMIMLIAGITITFWLCTWFYVVKPVTKHVDKITVEWSEWVDSLTVSSGDKHIKVIKEEE